MDPLPSHCNAEEHNIFMIIPNILCFSPVFHKIKLNFLEKLELHKILTESVFSTMYVFMFWSCFFKVGNHNQQWHVKKIIQIVVSVALKSDQQGTSS